MRHRIAAVGCVDEERARFAVVVGVLDDLVEEIACPHRLPDFAVARVAQIEISVGFDGGHEFVGDGYRDVEVGNGAFFGLALNEFFNIWMVHAQDAHIGAAAGVVGDHAVGQVGVVAVDFEIEGQRLTGGFSPRHMDEPQVLHRTGVFCKFRMRLGQFTVPAQRQVAIAAHVAQQFASQRRIGGAEVDVLSSALAVDLRQLRLFKDGRQPPCRHRQHVARFAFGGRAEGVAAHETAALVTPDLGAPGLQANVGFNAHNPLRALAPTVFVLVAPHIDRTAQPQQQRRYFLSQLFGCRVQLRVVMRHRAIRLEQATQVCTCNVRWALADQPRHTDFVALGLVQPVDYEELLEQRAVNDEGDRRIALLLLPVHVDAREDAFQQSRHLI